MLLVFVLTKTKRREDIVPVLKSLHWLAVFESSYEALHVLARDYLSEMLLVYEPGRPLRSSCSSLLAVPQAEMGTRVSTNIAHKVIRLDSEIWDQ